MPNPVLQVCLAIFDFCLMMRDCRDYWFKRRVQVVDSGSLEQIMKQSRTFFCLFVCFEKLSITKESLVSIGQAVLDTGQFSMEFNPRKPQVRKKKSI